MYSNLFAMPDPTPDDEIDPDSLTIPAGALVEAGLRQAQPGVPYQFMRIGYFTADPDSTPEHPVFNLIVTLKDSSHKG